MIFMIEFVKCERWFLLFKPFKMRFFLERWYIPKQWIDISKVKLYKCNHLDFHWFECTRLPAHNSIFAWFGQHKIPKPSATINIIPVDISCWKIGKVHKLGIKWFFRFQSVMSVRATDCFFNAAGIKLP